MKMSKTRLMIGALCLAAVIGLAVIGWQVQKAKPSHVPKEKITIAYSTASNAILCYIAFAQGYFAEEGLDATPQPHAFGKLALQAVIEGKADIATSGDTPIVFAVMNGEKISILATIQTSNKNEGIVARQDRGIDKPSDLRGKTMGVTQGTTGDFFADSFLLVNGIDRKDVQFVNMKPGEMPAALDAGRVDAVSTWNPTLIQLQKKLGNVGRVFYGETIYTETFNLVAQQAYIKKNPETVPKVLRAMIKAETFVRRRPEEARRLAAEFVKADKAILDETWDIFNLRVELDQALLVNLEDQSRWAIKHKWTKLREVPNYLEFIYYDGLQAVKPEAVRIIR